MEDSFYVLDTLYASNTHFFAGGQVIAGIETRCPSCNSLFPLQERGTINIAINHLGKKGFVEYLWNSHTLPIFRIDLINLWLEAGLSGFITKPVQIIGWFRNSKRPLPDTIPSYRCLIPISHVQLTEPSPEGEKCILCGFTKYNFPKIGNYLSNGLHIGMSTWNGADFFGLIGYPWIFCSNQVLEITLPKRYKHISFIHVYNWNKWEPFDINKWTSKAYYNYINNFLIR